MSNVHYFLAKPVKNTSAHLLEACTSIHRDAERASLLVVSYAGGCVESEAHSPFGARCGLELRTSSKPPQWPLELQSECQRPWAHRDLHALSTVLSTARIGLCLP